MVGREKKSKRIGIFRGTFDSIHDGHVEFALSSIEIASLDFVVFLPEKEPLHKTDVSHVYKRFQSISNMIKPFLKLKVISLREMNGSVKMALPALKHEFGGGSLVFLMGSDVAKTLPMWPDLGSLSDYEVIVGLRGYDKKTEIEAIFESLEPQIKQYMIINVPKPHMSSSDFR